MLILKNLAINLYLISDPKYRILYRKKQKKITTVAAFKTKIKRWKHICSCKIGRIGYVDV